MLAQDSSVEAESVDEGSISQSVRKKEMYFLSFERSELYRK